MKLTFFESNPPNFGDELNKYLWSNLIEPDFFDEDESTLFLGVGSILWDHYPKEASKIVMGSGYGGYTPIPNVHDGSWDITFVRGPRTAQQLNIDKSKVITDAAILAKYLKFPLHIPSPNRVSRIGFMPHYQSIPRACWKEVCDVAGLVYLDPTEPNVTNTISIIKSCDFIISEAMHGVILADTLRVPWIPIQPKVAIHRNKWFDWAESMDLSLRFNDCPNSSILDFWSSFSGLQATGKRSNYVQDKLKMINSIFVNNAAKTLSNFLIDDAFLSSDSVFERNSVNALEALSSKCKIVRGIG
ncbi:polysaccharide pyruvyl transferase family protein [uncultured Shewanella sp.]|uniref:polysaccharide pyruvyl transferase family protein n=1 Tax=uncultured Shewanella sp. TaxID=173975 RepID=UPI003704ACC0